MLSKRGLIELDIDEIVISDTRALKRALEYAHEWLRLAHLSEAVPAAETRQAPRSAFGV